MVRLEFGSRRRGGAGRVVGVAVALVLAGAYAWSVTRTVTATTAVAKDVAPPDRAARLQRLLDAVGLPPTFSYGGITWHADRIVRARGEQHLRPAGQLLGGIPVFHAAGAGAPGGPPEDELYLPASTQRRLRLYIRYERLVPPGLPKAKGHVASPPSISLTSPKPAPARMRSAS